MSASTITGTGRHMEYADWMTAAEESYRRLDALLAELSDDDWARPTDCAKWSVHDVVAHLAGTAETTARIPELARQAWRGRRLRDGGPLIDGINAVQVLERADATPQDLRRELADAAERGLRARRRLPAAVRAVRIPFGPPLGTQSLGYLTGRIYTRDAWMHRIDIARATGRPLVLTADHDRLLVEDVAVEWAAIHGRPFRLVLTGPAGGTWSRGSGGEELELDAIEFGRIMAGRAPGTGLLAHTVPF